MGLAHYRAVLRQQRLPMWWRSKQITCPIGLTDLSTDELWFWHEELLTLLRRHRKEFSKACNGSLPLLEVKRELTCRLYRTCSLSLAVRVGPMMLAASGMSSNRWKAVRKTAVAPK